MNVLLTGSAGYIGPIVARRLRDAGHQVTGYDTGWFGSDTATTWFVRGDIREPLVHPGWADVVVHLAGLSNDPMGDLSPALTRAINVWGTIDMVDRHPKARHVVISSCAVYGQSDTLCDETSTPNPLTAYAEGKRMVDDWLEGRGFNHTILRLGTVYGPSPNHRLDLVVNRMSFDALHSRGVRVFGNANRPLTHIEDVASAIQWAVEGTQRGIYNVVGENARMLSIAREVGQLAAVPVVLEGGGADARDYMASGSKALAAGWHPTRTVAASLPGLFEFTQGIGRDDLDDHIRITQLRRLMDAATLDPKTLRHAA